MKILPILVWRVDCLLSIALSNAGNAFVQSSVLTCFLQKAERDFSRLKLTKTRLRNCLKQCTLNALLSFGINWPSSAEFNFNKCSRAFCSTERRAAVQTAGRGS